MNSKLAPRHTPDIEIQNPNMGTFALLDSEVPPSLVEELHNGLMIQLFSYLFVLIFFRLVVYV